MKPLSMTSDFVTYADLSAAAAADDDDDVADDSFTVRCNFCGCLSPR